VAKVMISLPDDLLARIDAEARRLGSTRSGVIRAFTTQALDGDAEALRARLRALQDQAGAHGGGAVNALRAGRMQRERRLVDRR
jgi:hypothetical protein